VHCDIKRSRAGQWDGGFVIEQQHAPAAGVQFGHSTGGNNLDHVHSHGGECFQQSERHVDGNCSGLGVVKLDCQHIPESDELQGVSRQYFRGTVWSCDDIRACDQLHGLKCSERSDLLLRRHDGR
jgi:hypothetical protein